jgi:hypothetical protein
MRKSHIDALDFVPKIAIDAMHHSSVMKQEGNRSLAVWRPIRYLKIFFVQPLLFVHDRPIQIQTIERKRHVEFHL